MWHFCIAFCASVSYRELVFERNSHKVTRNANSCSHVGFTRLLLSAFSCWLPWSVQLCWLVSPADCPVLSIALVCAFFCSFWDLPFLVLFVSPWKFRAKAICRGFAPKWTKGYFDWHTPTPTETNAQHRATVMTEKRSMELDDKRRSSYDNVTYMLFHNCFLPGRLML